MQRLQAVSKTVETRRTTSKLSLTYAHSHGMFARTMSKQNKLERFGCRMTNEYMDRLAFVAEHLGLASSVVVRLSIQMIHNYVVGSIEHGNAFAFEDLISPVHGFGSKSYAEKRKSKEIPKHRALRLPRV